MKTYQKEDVIEEIKKELTIKTVCKKLKLSRQTVYRWMKEDKKFKKEFQQARKEAIEEMNDECENMIIQKIKDGDNGMIKYWLKYHHDDYKQAYILTK